MALAAKDISRWQGSWVDTGEPIVFVKITGGDQGLYVDPQAASNYNAVIAAGKAFGGYHFAGGGDPIAEANYFLSNMKPWNAGEVPALDWEIQHPDPVGWVNQFVTHVHDVAGAWPLVYMNLATLNAHDWTSVLTNCGLWLADWTGNPDSVINVGYKGYVMLQYNDGPNYDHDEWESNLETFKKYGWPGPTPEPAPTPNPTPAPEPTPVEPTPEPTPTPPPTPTTPTQEQPPVPEEPAAPVQASPQAAPTPAKKSFWEKLVIFFYDLVRGL